MDNGRNTSSIEARPLSARSVVLSTLLGTTPPVLPGRSLVALGERFGLAPGAVRTALSRMVRMGELDAVDGRYRLVGPLLERQAAQELGRRPPPRTWDGRWHVVAVTVERRDVNQRRAFRTRMVNARFGELRPELWLRPANLPAPAGLVDAVVVTGPLAGTPPSPWDLAAWSARGVLLVGAMAAAQPGLQAGDADQLAPTFQLSAAVVRHQRADPLLPAALLPDGWPGDELRAAYDAFNAAFQATLRAFLRSAR